VLSTGVCSAPVIRRYLKTVLRRDEKTYNIVTRGGKVNQKNVKKKTYVIGNRKNQPKCVLPCVLVDEENDLWVPLDEFEKALKKHLTSNARLRGEDSSSQAGGDFDLDPHQAYAVAHFTCAKALAAIHDSGMLKAGAGVYGPAVYVTKWKENQSLENIGQSIFDGAGQSKARAKKFCGGSAGAGKRADALQFRSAPRRFLFQRGGGRGAEDVGSDGEGGFCESVEERSGKEWAEEVAEFGYQ